MTSFALYVESGPKHRHTMVHVLDLLGCTAQGPTTEAALEASPAAIREFLAFLDRHGDPVNPAGAFETHVVQHVTEGSWIGNGDPPSGFPPDFEPLGPVELKQIVLRLRWLREDIGAYIATLTPEQIEGQAGEKRPPKRILEHLAEASPGYLRYGVGKVPGLPEASRAFRESRDIAALRHAWQIQDDRWAALDEDERNRHVPHGQLTWTARRGLRRTLEHEWEHYQELRERLGRRPLTHPT